MIQDDGTKAGDNGRKRRSKTGFVGAAGTKVRRYAEQGREAASTIAEPVTDAVNTAKELRKSVVMVRLDEESLEHIDILVDCGLARSRSEAAAFLIGEGIKERADLYEKIAAQADIIRQARQELQSLLNEEVEEE